MIFEENMEPMREICSRPSSLLLTLPFRCPLNPSDRSPLPLDAPSRCAFRPSGLHCATEPQRVLPDGSAGKLNKSIAIREHDSRNLAGDGNEKKWSVLCSDSAPIISTVLTQAVMVLINGGTCNVENCVARSFSDSAVYQPQTGSSRI